MTDEKRELEDGLRELGLSAPPGRAESLIHFLDILEETNKSFNLTRIARQDYVKLHLLDSFAGLCAVPLQGKLSIIDIGTGAGFPGVPLAALLPEARVTLLDSTLKKVRFAEESAKACGLANISSLHARAEKIAHDPRFRESFDVAVSRAVAPYPKLIEWMLPLVKPGGVAVALKGSGYDEEMAGCSGLLDDLGGGTPVVHPVRIPGTDIERFIIEIPKTGRTLRHMPRS